jgi:hypothetical protein
MVRKVPRRDRRSIKGGSLYGRLCDECVADLTQDRLPLPAVPPPVDKRPVDERRAIARVPSFHSH